MTTGDRAGGRLVPTRGRHLIAEYRKCAPALLDDAEQLLTLVRAAAVAAGAVVVAEKVQRFAPQGVSVVVVIEESHLSLHTWPEAGYAAADFYTCGDCSPEKAHEVLRQGLAAQEGETLLLTRGLLAQERSIEISGAQRWEPEQV